MTSPASISEPDFDDVSAEEQIEVPDWHLEIIRERMTWYRANGFDGVTWEEFEKELEKELTES